MPADPRLDCCIGWDAWPGERCSCLVGGTANGLTWATIIEQLGANAGSADATRPNGPVSRHPIQRLALVEYAHGSTRWQWFWMWGAA